MNVDVDECILFCEEGDKCSPSLWILLRYKTCKSGIFHFIMTTLKARSACPLTIDLKELQNSV